MVEDYYAVLGVDRQASTDEIKRAYRRLTVEFHPDKHPGDEGVQERYRLINQAYDVLSDASTRVRYDAGLRLSDTGLDLSRGFDGKAARDLLGNVFGDVFGSKRRERRRGRDLRYTLSMSLEDAVLGSQHEIEFEAPGPCTKCEGTGTRPGGRPPQSCEVCGGRGEVKGDGLFARRTRCGRCDGTGMVQQDACETCRGKATQRQDRAFTVKVPPGTESGAQKVLERLGEPGRYGGDPGDLRVTINVRRHKWLQRRGDEIRCEVPISVTEAALGARVTVPTVDGLVTVDVPAGLKSGTRLRLRGKGVPQPSPSRRSRRPGKRGDQLVTIAIETPRAPAGGGVAAALSELEAVSEKTGALPNRAEQRGDLADAPPGTEEPG